MRPRPRPRPAVVATSELGHALDGHGRCPALNHRGRDSQTPSAAVNATSSTPSAAVNTILSTPSAAVDVTSSMHSAAVDATSSTPSAAADARLRPRPRPPGLRPRPRPWLPWTQLSFPPVSAVDAAPAVRSGCDLRHGRPAPAAQLPLRDETVTADLRLPGRAGARSPDEVALLHSSHAAAAHPLWDEAAAAAPPPLCQPNSKAHKCHQDVCACQRPRNRRGTSTADEVVAEPPSTTNEVVAEAAFVGDQAVA